MALSGRAERGDLAHDAALDLLGGITLATVGASAARTQRPAPASPSPRPAWHLRNRAAAQSWASAL
jgi:hypothetical protein